MSKKKRSKTKPVELTTYEKLQQAMEDGKILSRPFLEGADELKTTRLSSPPAGYLQIGMAQGVTFVESDSSRTSNWHRIDYWIVANVNPEHLEEARELLDDYMVDKLADKYNSIVDANE